MPEMSRMSLRNKRDIIIVVYNSNTTKRHQTKMRQHRLQYTLDIILLTIAHNYTDYHYDNCRQTDQTPEYPVLSKYCTMIFLIFYRQ